MKFKNVALVGLFAASALVGCSDNKEENTQQQAAPAPVTQPAVVAAPVEQPAAVVAPVTQAAPVVKQGDNAQEKQAKLMMLAKGDVAFLQGQGYKITSANADLGKCNDATDAGKYHGTSTGMTYTVTVNGSPAKVCVDHAGKDGVKRTIGSVNALTPAPLLQSAPAQAPAAPAVDAKALEKKEKLTALATADVAVLASNGYIINGKDTVLGTCQPDGTNDRSGYHGTSTGITYPVTKGNQNLAVCVAHSGKNGSKITVGQPLRVVR